MGLGLGSRGRASSRSVEPGFGPSPGSGIRYTMVGFPGGIQAHRIKLISICRVSFGWEWRMSLDMYLAKSITACGLATMAALTQY